MSRIFGGITQLGYVVRDARASVEHWIEQGVGPWWWFERVPIDWFTYRGEPSSPELTIALANSGALQLEIIQQHNDAPSMYRDFLQAGREGLQHVSTWTHDFPGLYDRAVALGYTVGQEGAIGGPDGRFAYFDTETHPGTVIEIASLAGSRARFFERIRDAAADWDGTNPIITPGR